MGELENIRLKKEKDESTKAGKKAIKKSERNVKVQKLLMDIPYKNDW